MNPKKKNVIKDRKERVILSVSENKNERIILKNNLLPKVFCRLWAPCKLALWNRVRHTLSIALRL